MGKNVNTADLVTVLRELFSRTASDGGPQFTSKKFQSFAVQWGFTTPLPAELQKGGSNCQVDEENFACGVEWKASG